MNDLRFLVAWSKDRNLSGLYNELVMSLPNNDDWVVIQDRDCYWPHPFFANHIKLVLEQHGRQYSLFTCMTNRVNQRWQCVDGMWGVEQADEHERKARELWDTYGDSVEDVTNRPLLSGMFLAIKKSLLSKNRLLPDGLLLGADNELHKLAIEAGEKVGIMKGVYIWHYYRGKSGNKSHLL